MRKWHTEKMSLENLSNARKCKAHYIRCLFYSHQAAKMKQLPRCLVSILCCWRHLSFLPTAWWIYLCLSYRSLLNSTGIIIFSLYMHLGSKSSIYSLRHSCELSTLSLPNILNLYRIIWFYVVYSKVLPHLDHLHHLKHLPGDVS